MSSSRITFYILFTSQYDNNMATKEDTKAIFYIQFLNLSHQSRLNLLAKIAGDKELAATI